MWNGALPMRQESSLEEHGVVPWLCRVSKGGVEAGASARGRRAIDHDFTGFRRRRINKCTPARLMKLFALFSQPLRVSLAICARTDPAARSTAVCSLATYIKIRIVQRTTDLLKLQNHGKTCRVALSPSSAATVPNCRGLAVALPRSVPIHGAR